jgi:hypothetical protein
VTKNEDGQILVDSSELFRVFQPKRVEPRVMTQDAAVNATHEAHEADDTALRLAVAETKIEALHAMVEELQRARDSWQAQAERLALIAPAVISAPGPVATTEADAPMTRDKNIPRSEPEARRRSLIDRVLGRGRAA